MKTILLSLVIFSCSMAIAKQVPLDTTLSQVEWVGEKKVPGGDHNGTVKIKKGTVNLDESMKLTGGSVVVDLTTIEDKDLTGKWKQKLEGHLASEDFFSVKSHPEATFKITKVEPTRSNLYSVTGNLTVRGKTNTETFDVTITEKNLTKDKKKTKVLVATGTILVDRTKYGITYNSEKANLLEKAAKVAKDKIIKDQFKLTLNLQTQSI